MPSTGSIVLLVFFLCLVVLAQLNVSSLLHGLAPMTTNDDGALQTRVLQLQSELRAVAESKRKLEFQMNSLLNKTTLGGGGDINTAQILATLAKLETQLNEMSESKELLELRVNAWMNWNSDPYLGSTVNSSLCKNSTDLSDYGCAKGKNGCPGLYDHPVCMDNFPPTDHECIVYDFGIRENPEFGQTLLGAPFYCHVFGFDPSPITQKWYESSSKSATYLRNHANYTLFHYGAGGKDGSVQLNEYDWGQVSIIRSPLEIQRNCTNKNTTRGNCALDTYAYTRKKFPLPVKTLDTIMKELGHSYIDILKIDVEGSEYMFLEHALEHGNLERVSQLSIEWHHYDFDARYGGGSTPPINTIVALLNRVGLHQFHIHDDIGGWPSTGREYWEKGITLRYNLASFLRVS